MRYKTSIALLLCALALAGCPSKPVPGGEAPLVPKDAAKVASQGTLTGFSPGVTETDEPAPDFTLKDTAGNEITKADYSGKVLILDFWATWCDACIKKLKEYQPILDKYTDKGVELLAVSLDAAPEVAAGWAQKNNFPFRIAMLNDELKAAYFPEVTGSIPIPQVRIIDRDGNLRYKFTSDSTAADLDLAVQKLVEEKVGGDETVTDEVMSGQGGNAADPQGSKAAEEAEKD